MDVWHLDVTTPRVAGLDKTESRHIVIEIYDVMVGTVDAAHRHVKVHSPIRSPSHRQCNCPPYANPITCTLPTPPSAMAYSGHCLRELFCAQCEGAI